MTDSDLASAILIALVIILVALAVWPGYLRVRAAQLEGHWASTDGAMYEIRPTGPRTFLVVAAGGCAGVAYRVAGVRGVRADAPSSTNDRGRVDLGGRRISWADGHAWTFQGIRR